MAFIKKMQYEQLNNDFETMSTMILSQFTLVEFLLNKGWQENIYEQVAENETILDRMEVTIMKKLQEMFLFFSPKAKELRKIISCHESILSLEQIGDLLMDFVEHLQKTDLHSPDCKEMASILRQMFDCLKQMIHAVTFSFFTEDKEQAYQIIEKENNVKKFSCELTDNIIADFQEMPLSGRKLQSLIHLHTMAYILEKVRTNAVLIAKSTVFAIEGIDVRH
ncbi:MAG: phosphate uptake regulator PhoU [Candidatus Azobacteroides sp.]|nr:phosphate uptake regulator PhoU [Candidatus Azobacteroides sp.]